MTAWFRQVLLFWVWVTLFIWPQTSSQAAEPATNPPLVTIREFLDGGRRWSETNRLRLQGVVTASLSDKTYFLQNGDAGVYVFHRPAVGLRVGEWVEVTGRPSLGNLKPLLDGIAVRSIGSRELPPPIDATFAEAISGQHHMRLIRIKGRLAEERPNGTSFLVLNAGGSTNSFLASLETFPDHDVTVAFQPGSLLELTGICRVRTDATRTRPASFTVLARSAADVVVLSGPPWWTLKRMLVLLGIALGALGLALLWGWTLRQQVRRQTADLRARLEERTAFEERYRQLFEANPHPMWVYDMETLHFLAVNDAAIRHYGYSRPEFLGKTLRDIRPPEDLPAFEKDLASVTTGFNAAGMWRHRKKDGLIIEVEITSHTTEFDGHQAKMVLAMDVTERRRAEEALRRSAQYRRAIIEAEPECVKVVAADGTLLDMNTAGLAMLEAGSLAEATLCPLTRYILPEHHAAFSELHQRVMAGGNGILEFEIQGLKGTRRWLETHAVLMPGTDGGAPALLGITRDITERKRTQAELQRSQERFATIFRTNLDAITIVRVADERIVEVNPGFERLMGFKAEEAVGRTTAELGLWPDPAERTAMIESIKAEGSLLNAEARLHSKSGRVFDVLSSAEIIDYAGQRCMLSLTRDITERKAAEERLRRSEASLATAQRIASLGSWELDLTDLDHSARNPLTWSDEVFRIFGHEPGGIEVNNQNFFLAVHPDDRERVRVAVAEAIAQRRSYRIEHRIIRPDGTERTVEEYSEILYDPGNGRPLRMLGVVQDITERTVAERALGENRRRYAELVRTVEGIVWEADARTIQFTFVSEQAERLLGYPTQQWSEPDFWSDHLHPDDRDRATEYCLAATRQGLNHDFEYRMMAADGRAVWLRDIVTVVVENGEPRLLRGVMVDITARKEAEEKIRNINAELEQRVAQRTAELAEANKELESFSYSVSHDLRAPLRAVEGFSNILQQECAPQLEAKGLRYLDRVRVGTRRMGALIDDLLKLSRFTRAPMTRIDVDMTQIVLASLAELRSGDPERQVEAVVAPGVRASCDSSLLRAALQNLVDNAWKYSSRRSPSRIEFGVLDRDGERVFFVRDDGVGFDMAFSGKLFGAFQRLHGVDEFEGTGIGLATVQRIIHRHGGRIWAEAAVNQGATFYFTLAAKPVTPALKP